MLIGLDHLALSCTGTNRLLDETNADYELKFCINDTLNHPAKTPFLSHYQKTHSLAYYQSADSLNIELIDHGCINHAEIGLYIPLCYGANNILHSNKDTPYRQPLAEAMRWRNPMGGLWTPFGAPILFDLNDSRSSFGFSQLLVPVSKPDQSREFWIEGLGFISKNRRLSGSDCKWEMLSFNAIKKSWSVDIILCDSAELVNSNTLDSTGFPCLCFLSSNLAKDAEKIRETGAACSTGPFLLNMHDKQLSIEIFRGPSGELVELIQIDRFLK